MKKTDDAKNDLKTDNTSTQDKIKEAARKLFTSNGFAAVTTRDIAAEAGINQALLHYYFRSKEKLFEIIMLENLNRFVAGVRAIINDEQTTLEQKIEILIATYIDNLSKEPELPLFIVNQIKSNPDDLLKKLRIESAVKNSYLLKQLRTSDYSNLLKSLNPLHIVINLVGLTVAPFLMAPILQKIMKLNNQQLIALVQERKALIPEWILAMIKKGPEK